MPSFLSPAARTPGGSFSLVRDASGEIVVSELELAIESATRRKGLLGRDVLPAGTGLMIAPSNAVHTFFMRFPIDIVFLGRAGNVLKICADVGPTRLAACWRGFAVLELPAGETRNLALVVGERLRLQPVGET